MDSTNKSDSIYMTISIFCMSSKYGGDIPSLAIEAAKIGNKVGSKGIQTSSRWNNDSMADS